MLVAQEIKDKDEPILQNLSKIELILIEHSDNFSLQFHFQPNEFFSNSVLKKTFILRGNECADLPFYFRDGLNPIKSDSTLIEWKENRNPTKKGKGIRRKTHDHKDTEPEAESFFNFFRPINLEDEEWLESQKEDDVGL
jgi:hypothetical protein